MSATVEVGPPITRSPHLTAGDRDHLRDLARRDLGNPRPWATVRDVLALGIAEGAAHGWTPTDRQLQQFRVAHRLAALEWSAYVARRREAAALRLERREERA